MMRSRTLVTAAVLALVGCAGPTSTQPARAGPAQAAAPAAAAPREKGALEAEYEALVARARADDRSTDVARLRVTAGATIADHREASTALKRAVRKQDWPAVLAAADAVLALNFADLEAHHFARRAAHALGDTVREEHHAWLADTLYRAFRTTGEGHSPEAPLVVITVGEEYYLLGVSGLDLVEQSLVTCRGRPCDRLQTKDEAGATSTWYFDVSATFERMQRALGGGGAGR